jgi:predicted  nucleic acid-binding Zn-ribbon protein
MKKSQETKGNEFFSYEDIASAIRQELEDARGEHEILSTILMKVYDDDDAYILEDYVDNLQEYIDELENQADAFDNLRDIRDRLSDDIEKLKSKFKQLRLL